MYKKEAEEHFQETLARELNRVIRKRFGSVEQKAARDLGITRQRLRRYTTSRGRDRMTPNADLFLYMVAAWDLKISYGGFEFCLRKPRADRRPRVSDDQTSFEFIEERNLAVRITKREPGRIKLAVEIRASA